MWGYVPTNTHSSQGESQLYIFEDNEAVIKMTIKGRSPTMRHLSRVALGLLFDRINLEPTIQIKDVHTKNQLADILTKESFSRDEWNHLLRLFNIMSFSMFSCCHFSDFLPRSEEISSQSLGSLVNPVKTDERKELEIAAGNSWRSASRSEMDYSQASR